MRSPQPSSTARSAARPAAHFRSPPRSPLHSSLTLLASTLLALRYVVDAFIIVSALWLELYLWSLHDSGLATLTGLLVLARSWRFVRIGHTLFAIKVR